MLKALGGGYVLPEAGGDLLRDGTGVLPTGGWACRAAGAGALFAHTLHVVRGASCP